jgi:hypothetical protein
MIKINRAEVERHAQVRDDVLVEANSVILSFRTAQTAHHGFHWNGPALDLDGCVCRHASLVECPGQFTTRYPRYVL